MASKLTIDDIADLRAYEREREEFRDHVIALKKKRRIPVGPVVTLVFENRDTVRFQVQEMARAERMLTDEAIQTELDIYNPLIPEAGHLSATMFLELRDKDELTTWLPRLVGIERAVELRLAGDTVVRCTPDPSHEAQLTRDEVTASVHYVTFSLSESDIAAFEEGPVAVALRHPDHEAETALSEETVTELLADLRG
jgi:hypothetical protein